MMRIITTHEAARALQSQHAAAVPAIPLPGSPASTDSASAQAQILKQTKNTLYSETIVK